IEEWRVYWQILDVIASSNSILRILFNVLESSEELQELQEQGLQGLILWTMSIIAEKVIRKHLQGLILWTMSIIAEKVIRKHYVTMRKTEFGASVPNQYQEVELMVCRAGPVYFAIYKDPIQNEYLY
ncbi:9643_t:CDS:2, partial [Ambispora leptoticha]